MRKYESLKRSIDFKSVYDKHKSKADKYLVMYILKNKLDHNRLGISVSKKVGNSVVRHRLARLVRESMRLHQDEFNSGLDIVVVVRASANPKKNSNNAENARPLKCSDVERSLLHLASQHKILSD